MVTAPRALVYAYGCAAPLSGWAHALIEHERCTQLWDRLVEIDRAIERETLLRAQDDDARLREIGEEIGRLTERLAEEPGDKDARCARRLLYREQRERLKDWRKAHKDAVRELELRRQRSAKLARQQTDAYWGNYLRVLQHYETGRAVARQFGRRLRPHDEERDDGVLAVQIQRTRSGLGAAPCELQDGSVSALQLSAAPSPRRHSHLVEMRVDAAGHTVRLPVWLHRPLPDACRVKAAQLVWRRKAHRIVWRLCLYISSAAPAVSADVGTSAAVVSFGWNPNGVLTVLTVEHAGERRSWSLPADWMRRMDLAERMQQQLDAALEAGGARWRQDRTWGAAFADGSYLSLFERLQSRWPDMPDDLRAWYRETRRVWRSWSGLRSRALGQRRELYRLMAREVVQRYPALELTALDLAAIAREERGEERNSWRHRAAIHTLRAELIHQANKLGRPVIASGKVVNTTANRKSGAWARRKSAKAAALATPPPTP